VTDDRETATQRLKFGATVIYVDGDVPGVLDFYHRAFGLKARFYDPTGALLRSHLRVWGVGDRWACYCIRHSQDR
jgi:hypothetical protein